jgi:hypothetical protein
MPNKVSASSRRGGISLDIPFNRTSPISTTVPLPLSDLGLLLPISDLSSFSLTGTIYGGGTLTGVILNPVGFGTIHLNYSNNGGNNGANPAFFLPADFSSPGSYTDTGGSTMVVTAVATPEPSSLAFMLAGVGLVFAMRKRFSGLQLAS